MAGIWELSLPLYGYYWVSHICILPLINQSMFFVQCSELSKFLGEHSLVQKMISWLAPHASISIDSKRSECNLLLYWYIYLHIKHIFISYLLPLITQIIFWAQCSELSTFVGEHALIVIHNKSLDVLSWHITIHILALTSYPCHICLQLSLHY